MKLRNNQKNKKIKLELRNSKFGNTLIRKQSQLQIPNYKFQKA